MSEKILKIENFKADGILVMKDDIEGNWQVASVNQWIKNGNEIAELFASAPELLNQNIALLEALEDCLTLIDNNGLSPRGNLRKKVAEAIQGKL